MNCSNSIGSGQRVGLKAIFNQIKLSIQSLKFKYSFSFFIPKAVSRRTRDYISIFKTAFSLYGSKKHFGRRCVFPLFFVFIFIFVSHGSIFNSFFALPFSLVAPFVLLIRVCLCVRVHQHFLSVFGCICDVCVYISQCHHCFVHGECGCPINISPDSCSCRTNSCG